jgi:hypothetical protein
MTALRIVLAGLVLFYPWAVAEAQQNGPSTPPVWTPVPNCQTANALGPQVYLDVAAGAPNAGQEMQLLNQALRMCEAANGGAQGNQPQPNMVVPESGSPDPNGPPQQNGPPPDYSGPGGPPPSNSGGGGSVFTGVLQALQNLANMYFQFCQGPGINANACSPLNNGGVGALSPLGGGSYSSGYSGGGNSYSAPQSLPSYARPYAQQSQGQTYGLTYRRQAYNQSGYYPQPWAQGPQQGYYQQPWAQQQNRAGGGYNSGYGNNNRGAAGYTRAAGNGGGFNPYRVMRGAAAHGVGTLLRHFR